MNETKRDGESVTAQYQPIDLPQPGQVQNGWLVGRNAAEGYQRGVSLEFGDAPKKIEAHPLFRMAMAAARDYTLLDYKRSMNLFLLVLNYFPKLDAHNIVEFGSYRGGSLIFMGTLLRELYPTAKIYGFDTFAGMPVTDSAVDLHTSGDFSDSSIEGVQQALERAQLQNVVLVKGLVQETFPQSIPAGTRFGLAHIDLDIYHPIRYAQTHVLPMLVPGGYLVYDDATVSTCIGATQAVEELIQEGYRSEQVFPHFVFRRR